VSGLQLVLLDSVVLIYDDGCTVLGNYYSTFIMGCFEDLFPIVQELLQSLLQVVFFRQLFYVLLEGHT